MESYGPFKTSHLDFFNKKWNAFEHFLMIWEFARHSEEVGPPSSAPWLPATSGIGLHILSGPHRHVASVALRFSGTSLRVGISRSAQTRPTFSTGMILSWQERNIECGLVVDGSFLSSGFCGLGLCVRSPALPTPVCSLPLIIHGCEHCGWSLAPREYL